MGILKKMGKAMGHAVAQAGRKTAAAIKKKNLQNKVKRMILERYKVDQLKKMIKEYGLPGPQMPDRGYYKKSDYVDYIYRQFKLKTVIEWAQRHKIPIKDIMDYYIAGMESIERQYGGKNRESEIEDEKEGVEDIQVVSSDFVAPEPNESFQNVTPTQSYGAGDEFFEELLATIERDFGEMIKEIKIVSEAEFQKHLYIFLKSRFEGHKIQKKVDWRADMLIDDKYALELKYADNRGTMDKGIREIKDYKKHTNYVAIIIFDPGSMARETLGEYIEYYEEEGARIVVLEGRGYRKKSTRETQIIVRR